MNFALQGSPYNQDENEKDTVMEKKKQQRKNSTLKRPNNVDRPIVNGRLNNSSSNGNSSSHVENMISSVHNNVSNDDDENQLEGFYPPPYGEIRKKGDPSQNIERANINEIADSISPKYKVTSVNDGGSYDGPVHTVEAFNNLRTANGGESTGAKPYGEANQYGVANPYEDVKTYGPVKSYTGANNYVGPYNIQAPNFTQMSQTNGKDNLLEKLNYMIHLLEEQQDEKTGHVVEELILYSFLGVFIIFIVDSFARSGKYTR
jgi:hypothetical protein